MPTVLLTETCLGWRGECGKCGLHSEFPQSLYSAVPQKICNPSWSPHLDLQRCELNAAKMKWRWQMRILFSTLLWWPAGLLLTCAPACPCSRGVTGEKSNRSQLWYQNRRMPPRECPHVHTHIHATAPLPKASLIKCRKRVSRSKWWHKEVLNSPPSHTSNLQLHVEQLPPKLLTLLQMSPFSSHLPPCTQGHPALPHFPLVITTLQSVSVYHAFI